MLQRNKNTLRTGDRPPRFARAQTWIYGITTHQAFLYAIRRSFGRAWPWAVCFPLCCCLAACRKETLDLRVFQAQSIPVSQDVMAIWFADSARGLAAGGRVWESGFILSTEDGGLRWRTDTLLPNRVEALVGSDGEMVYACGMDGRALARLPGRKAWEIFRTDYRWMRGAAFVGAQRGLIVAGEGYRAGQAFVFGPDVFWRLDTVQDFPNELAAVCFSDSLTAHAVGIGWVMRSEDAGRHWERLDVTGDFFRDVQFTSPDTGYICGSNGALLKTTDGGRHWDFLRKPGVGLGQPAFHALFFTDNNRGYAVGDRGLFWKTENGGADWQVVRDIPDHIDFTDIHAFDGKGWLSAREGQIYYFEE
jgi:photosystem II stability/assembly factor-like uncharacterized protein